MLTFMTPDRIARINAGELHFKLAKFEKTCDGLGEATGLKVESTDGELVCNNQDYYPHEVEPVYLRRIAAALNYCHGISTEELEKQNQLLGTNG